MAKRYRPTKAQKEVIFNAGEFKGIQSEETLTDYLIKNSNAYNDFMIFALERKKNSGFTPNGGEIHHIIPTSEGGPNASWNLVPLSFEEHCTAHLKRFEVYGKQGDRVAALGRDSLPENFSQFKTERARLGHQVMREKGIGFNNPALQSEFGKRSGGKKTPAREKAYEDQVSESKKQILEKSLLFKHEALGIEAISTPNLFPRTGQIKNFLVSLMVSKRAPQELINLIEGDKQFTTNINKVLNRALDPNAKLGRSSYKGWSVTINTFPPN